MFQGNRIQFQQYKTFQYCSCIFLFILAQNDDTYFNKKIPHEIRFKSNRAIMENYKTKEPELDSLEHYLYK